MIRRVVLEYFKCFENQEFELLDSIVLAGPNNSGKTTLLQALAVWNLCIQRWRIEKGGSYSGKQGNNSLQEAAGPKTTKSKKPKSRPGVRISRKDFAAIPLRNLDLLWHERHTAYRKEELHEGMKLGTPKLVRIHVEGESNGQRWELPVDLRYENPETLYAIPAVPDPYEAVAHVAEHIHVVHVPPFSGIGAEETRYDKPYQDLLIGQGKPGDILRNLLWEVWASNDKSFWEQLRDNVSELFKYQLLEPIYDQRPFILCEYIPDPDRKTPKLDISCAGSGFHQVLMLLGFFYARPASILLLDEPDAHQHVFLQKVVYNRLRLIARKRGCQLVLATHSEVILQSTAANHVISFYQKPHILERDTERAEVREAFKRLSALDLILAEEENGVLYTEGGSDLDLLREWARILHHPARSFLEKPLWHNNVGRNPSEAKGHHFALRAIRPNIKGLLLLDGDNRKLNERELYADGLEIIRWTRYEIENYLLVPAALERFVRNAAKELFQESSARRGRAYLEGELPPAVLRDPLGDHDYLNAIAASKTVLPRFFQEAGVDLAKSDYFQLAAVMEPNEIHMEIRKKLDRIAEIFDPRSSE